MSNYLPLLAILLAVVTAGSIVFIAWELSSRHAQDALEKTLGRTNRADTGTANEQAPDDAGATDSAPNRD